MLLSHGRIRPLEFHAMSLQLWLGFVLASIALLIIPGPTLMLVVGRALSHGRQSALRTVPGVALGDRTAIKLSAAGLGAVLATSAALFTAVKLVGAAYLFWLGVQMWRGDPASPTVATAPSAASPNLFLQAYTVTALNPKSIIFFVAFVPQFLSPATPLLPQLLVLIPTFVALAALNAALFALVAGSVRGTVQRPGVRLWLDRLGGSVLIGAGAMMLAWRRAT
jgi:threonine/homoserine/homoserine lactone efflux protein